MPDAEPKRQMAPEMTLVVLVIAATLLPAAASAADLAHGKRAFRPCASCHALQNDTNKFGPSLKGVFGRPAAAVADYDYSPAMRDAAAKGLVWDEATLAAYLANPAKTVPGTKMRFSGYWFQSEIDDVIAYIRSVD